MQWLRQRLLGALNGSAPLSKKALLTLGGIVLGAVFLITSTNQQAASSTVVLAADGTSSQAPNTTIRPIQILVHVVGEVAAPGVYQLEPNSRVADLIFAAGGFTTKADQSSINLARELTDGEQIIVLKTGVIGQSQITGGSMAGGAAVLISLNRASSAELESLPGVGPALAGRIIDWRNANGGFKKKEDLLNISGIGEKLFAGLKNQITP